MVAAYKEIPVACHTASDPFRPCFASWEVDAVGGSRFEVDVFSGMTSPFTRASTACQKENPGDGLIFLVSVFRLCVKCTCSVSVGSLVL